MVQLHHQLHGYRHGHELLASTIKLAKNDQELIDRLSDVAGPLSPGEQFAPYLTCYPLPTDSYYVFARTWQDLEAPRAGCVRTRSLIISMDVWATYKNLGELVELVSRLGPVDGLGPLPRRGGTQDLPEVNRSDVNELCEALFLEERKPIVMFGSAQAEAISLRLLSALWPAIRQKFSLSTLVYSPRKMGARSFDLMFAPRSARPRFQEWSGRRLDGNLNSPPRHKWTAEIVRRIFAVPVPSLANGDQLGQLSSDLNATEADLRVSLLWSELIDKLESSPTAALGLLDIASTRPAGDDRAFLSIEPELKRVAQEVVQTTPPSEAWHFLVAMSDKLQGTSVSKATVEALQQSVAHLAENAPEEAVMNFSKVAKAKSSKTLLPSLGDGLAASVEIGWQKNLTALPKSQFLQSLLASSNLAAIVLGSSARASRVLSDALQDASAELMTLSKHQLLPFLVENLHEKPFRKLVANLSIEELTAVILHMYEVNQLGASNLHEALWQQAGRLGAVATIRDTVASLDGQGADSILEHLLSGNLDDFLWLLNAPELAPARRRQLLIAVLRNVAEVNWSLLGPIYGRLLDTLADEPEVATDVIAKLLAEGWRDSAAAFKALLAVLPQLDQQRAQELCGQFVPWIMQLDESHRAHSDVEMLIETAGSSLDADATYQAALGRNLSSDMVGANLSVLSGAKNVAVRKSLLMSIERLAKGILDRGQFDLSMHASSHAAELLWAARDQNFWGHFRAATALLPFLLRERGEASSPLIAAAFPAVYTELKKENAAPDIFKLFFFVDWDRCKAMRIDLIEAFFASKWRPVDIALTAARTGDELKFFRRINRHDNGQAVIAAIEAGLDGVPGPWNDITRRAIANLDA